MAFNLGGAPGGNGNKGFSFGGAANTNAQTSGASTGVGFSFGAQAAPSTGFSFGGSPAPAATAGGLGGFGTPAATTAATATAGGFGGFGAAATSTPAPGGAAPTTGLFGGFGGAAPTSAATATPAASSGFSFGAKTTTGPAATGAGTGGFSFGGGAPTTTPAATTAAPAPTAGLSLGGTPAKAPATSGFSFGGTPSATPAATSGTAPGFAGFGTPQTGLGSIAGVQPAAATLGATKPDTAQTTAGFSLAGAAAKPTGGLTLGGTPTAAATTTSGLLGTPKQPAGTGGLTLGGLGATPTLGATAATTTAGAGLTLGGTPASTGGLKLGLGTTPTTAASTGGLSLKLGTAAPTTASAGLGLKPTGTASTTLGTAATAAVGTAAQAPAKMSYKQLEDSINKWSVELDEQEKVFLQQATQVNAWDRLLIDNADKITALNNDVECVKLDQQRLDQELDFILAQQRELAELLKPLEKAVEQLPPVNYQHHADLEREHTYTLSQNIDAQLKRMVQDLKEIIEHVNTNNSTQDTTDPVQQIAKILNHHMDSLQWVDQNTALLQRRVEDVARQSDIRRKEQERNFRLAYD